MTHKVVKFLYSVSSLALIVVGVLPGCVSHTMSTMMPAPIIYHNSLIDPFEHLAETQKSIKTRVFYATNRAPNAESNNLTYGNSLDDEIHLGVATVHMGDQSTDWEDLYGYSLANTEILSMPITLEKHTELASIPTSPVYGQDEMSPGLQAFFDSINEEISTSIDKEIMVYVHGAKVDFAISTILTAEVDHFAGRDFVGVAFAWPSHQNIAAYMTGIDVKRALASSAALRRLLVLLAKHTDAEHINILSYSAGAKVASKALFELSQAYSDLSPDQLKEKFRLGAVVFAAADVSVDVFLDRISSISNLSNQVVITVTDNDNALLAAKMFMGGAVRAGSQGGESIEEEFIVSKHLSNVEIIDVSLNHEIRGFDIEGHHYWYRHPWMSSDIIFLMRTDLPPAARGLTSSQMEGVWYLSSDYPEKAREALKKELSAQWGWKIN